MDLSLWREYLHQLDQLSGILEQLTQVQREKTAAVSRGDLAAVDACMKKEQVFSLNLRGFDQKRGKLMAQLGIAGTSLRQLEELSPPEAILETKRTAENLRQQYQVFQSASDVARNTLECNLRAIELEQKKQEAGPQGAVPQEVQQSDFRA